MNPPRVLLVYANPAVTASPVPPYGAERIAHAMRGAGCEVRLVSPFLERRPVRALDEAIAAFQPTLIGFSIRNLDDALVVRSPEGLTPLDTTFYLPRIRPLVAMAKARGVPALLGGAGFTAAPEGVLRYLGAEFGIVGAADDLAWRLGRALVGGAALPEALPDDPRVFRPQPPPATPRRLREPSAFRAPPGPTPRDAAWLTLARDRSGRVPVAISAGCDRRCSFCVEGAFVGGGVRPRPVEEVIHEIKLLRRADVRRVWLAASELNVPDARHATAILRALAAEKLGVDVTGFLQPAPVDDALLDAFLAVGVDPVGLSYEFGHLDDTLLRAGAGPANRASLDRLVALYQRRGHRGLGGSVLFGAHPAEDDASIDRALATARALDTAFPDGLGLAWAAGGRVYANAPLGRWVAEHLDDARPHLYGRLTPGFVAPLVYCKPGAPRELFARVQAGLSACRGPMHALNAETVLDPRALHVERDVNRGVLALAAGEGAAAARACRSALRLQPKHRDALETLALAQANLLGQPEAALATFRQLRGLVTGKWAEQTDRVIAQLEHHVGG